MQEPLIAGTSLITLRHYLETRHGPSALPLVLRALTPELAKAFAEPPSPLEWYPTASFLAALDRTREQFGPDDFYVKYGDFAADFAVHKFYRFVLHFLSPASIIPRAMRIWHRYHNTGTWDIDSGARFMRGTLRDFAVVHAGYCQMLVGWFRRAGELAGGGPELKVAHPTCRARGERTCVFTGEW